MNDTQLLFVSERFRYSKLARPDAPILDGLRNFHYVTHLQNHQSVQLESGISPVAKVGSRADTRRPAVLIRSSPHKAGTVWTPWHDSIDVIAGTALYWGDHKPNMTGAPEGTKGNKALLGIAHHHAGITRQHRLAAAPLAIFRGVPFKSPKGHTSQKGAVEFCGIGLITSFYLSDQIDQVSGRSYKNYRFDIKLVALPKDELDWQWINDRRDPTLTDQRASLHAPYAWRKWIDDGI